MERKSWMTSTLLFSAGVALSVLALEVGFRIIEATPAWRVLPVVARDLGWIDPVFGFTLRPNMEVISVRENRAIITTNAFGLRDADMTLDKPAGSLRVLLVGDSYTQAAQVPWEITFDALTEARLNRSASGRRVEVINLGMGGAGPLIQLMRADLIGLQFKPDLAVFLPTFEHFLNQQLAADADGPAYVFDDEGGLVIGRRYLAKASVRYRNTIIGHVFFWLMDNSRVFLLSYYRLRQGVFDDLPKPPPKRRDAADHCENLNEKIRRHLALWGDGEPSAARRRRDRFFDDLGAFMARSKLPVVIAGRGLGLERPECTDEMAMRDETSRLISDYLAARGVGFVDLDAEFSKRAGGADAARLLRGFAGRVGRGHLNQAGHRVYAEIIGDAIEDALAGAEGVD